MAISASTILLVSGNAMTRRLTRLAFEHEQLTLIEASDLASAGRLADTQRPDLLISDEWLADGDARQLAVALRQQTGKPDLPALIMVGRPSGVAGPDVMTQELAKPVDLSMLRALVSAYLSSGAAPPARRRLLVIDDNALNRKLSSLYLGQAG